MFLKNLLRRKIRTLLTVLGIAVGVAAIIALGALANGLEAGYGSMLTGSKADLIISQPDSFDITYSSVDEEIGEQLLAAPEVAEISPMVQGFIQAEGEPFFFVFGYPPDSFALGRFTIIAGDGLDSRQAEMAHGRPALLGSAAAEVLKKSVGDSLRLGGSVYRIIGIYQTGDAFEDSGAVLRLKDAQDLLARPRKVNLFYIRLKDPALSERFQQRVARTWRNLQVSGLEEFASQQTMADMLRGYVWAIGGLAIVIGGVGMMNAQLMAIMERTREIGVLRAVGWSSRRVLWMILMEAISVSLLGGLIGLTAGYLLIDTLSRSTVILGLDTGYIGKDLMLQAMLVVLILGLVGGVYPAWRASRLQPVEALRYEGGSSGAKMRRLPIGGMALQSLWQRSTRTLLTLGAIGLTVGAIIAMDGAINSAAGTMTDMFRAGQADIAIRQADISDTSLSAIDEQIGTKIAAMPEVQSISPMNFTAIMLPEGGGFFIIFGYAPRSLAIQQLDIVEGRAIISNHEIMIGRAIAETLKKKVGDTIELSGVRFKIVGIYESTVSWQELGGVVTLRDSQTLMGRPRKVTMYMVKLNNPEQAPEMVERINHMFPEVYAALTGDFVQQMPDMQNSDAMLGGISFIAILVGGIGVLNTMLMSVFERTREIGVLRALGWRRRRILGLIMRESLTLGLLGGLAGIGAAFVLMKLLTLVPWVGEVLKVNWELDMFLRAILVALTLGVIGGLYPAFRATRLQPVEALRYE